MRPQTQFLSRMFGVYCLVMGLFMLTHREAMRVTVLALMEDKPLMLLAAVFTVLGGLAMVLEHNIWRGGALPVIVTLLSWWRLIKGVLMLYIEPMKMFGFFYDPARYGRVVYFDAAFVLVLGVYLTMKGFELPHVKHA